MLPTEKSLLFIHKTTGSLHLSLSEVKQNNQFTKPQHLYIISDETPSIGDWYILHGSLGRYNGNLLLPPEAKKVIASTDSELTEYCKGVHRLGEGCNLINSCDYPNCRLHRIPESLIKTYVERYNAGNPIDKVMVKYWKVSKISDPSNEWLAPKLTENNEVIISIVEEKMYSREEVEDLCQLAAFWGEEKGISWKEFIKENL